MSLSVKQSELVTDKLSDRLRKSLTCDISALDDTNKPDSREPDLGSPVSPLRIGPAASSSSSSSGSASGRTKKVPHSGSTLRKSQSAGKFNNSGEVSSSPTVSSGGSPAIKPGHARSKSGGVTGGSSATSPAGNVLPTGNIFPSGKMIKTSMIASRNPKIDVLSLGTGNYGHGSIIKGGATTKSAASGGGEPDALGISNSPNSRTSSLYPADLKRLGNDQYKRGNFVEALSYYDRAIAVSPGNATYHCSRAAALMCLWRLTEAMNECDEAIKLDSGYVRAHHRLGSLLISLGQVENARKHLCFPGYQPNERELRKLQAVDKHLSNCTNARRVRDWNGVLKECDAAIDSGAGACPQLFACKAEALLKLRKLDEADLTLSNAPKFEAYNSPSCSESKFFGMLSEAYVPFVCAQIDMALGRFENAVIAIEKSAQIDPRNIEVVVLLQNVRLVVRARGRGNDLYKAERFTEACSAYGEGLRLDPWNPVLYCNRAASWFKVGQMERSLDDCNQALLIHPNYTKALLRRAATYSKLGRWAESVRDYEILRKEHPDNNDIAESLFHAQIALKKSRGEEVYNMKFGGEVELASSLDQFNAAIASTGASVVLFETSFDLQCKQISPFLDTLCARYPSINFLKVDVDQSPEIANAENIVVVPTVKIYKNRKRVKEMVCPNREILESSFRHYSI